MKATVDIDFLKEGSIAFTMNVLDKGTAFLAFVFFAQYFDPSVFGTAYAVLGVSALVKTLPLSVGTSLRKRVSETPDSFAAYATLGVGLLASYALTLYLVLLPVLSAFTLRYEAFALAGLAHMAARSYLFLIEQVAQATGRIGNASVLEFIDGITTVALRFGLILGLGFGAEGLIYGPAIAASVTGTGFYLLIFGPTVSMPSWTQAADLLQFFKWDAPSRLLYTALTQSETALAGLFIGPVSASYLKSAKTAVEPGLLPVQGLAQIVFVETSGRSSDALSVAATVRKGLRYAGVFSIPVLFGAVVFADRLMGIVFGSDYGGSGFVLIAAAVAIVCQSYRQILFTAVQGADRPDVVTYVHLLLSVVYIPVYVLVLSNDAFGLFVGVFASSYAAELVALWVMARYTVIEEPLVDWAVISKQLGAGAVMGAGLLLADSVFAIQEAVGLAAAVLAGAALYGGVLFTISSRLRRRVRDAVRRLQSR